MPINVKQSRSSLNYKIRTRGHIIADLSVNYVERIILETGHYMDFVVKGHDYGYDGQLFTCDNGAIENGHAMIQFKATDKLSVINKSKYISFNVSRADTNLWNIESAPVFLIVWDSVSKEAYWLYMQQYLSNLKKRGKFPLLESQNTLNVRLPKSNIVDHAAINELRRIKNDITNQIVQKVNFDV